MKTQPQLMNYQRKSSRRSSNRLTEKTRATKLPYYIADTGHFGIKIKVCFSDEAFQQAVKDSKITTRHNALDVGLAESHFIEQEGTTNAMLAIVFNYDEMAKETSLERMGVIYHEVSHTVTHVFEYIGEEDTKIGDESRSYLGEHIFKQVFSIYATEEDKRERAGERDREAFKQLGKKVKGSKLQVDQQRYGSAGSNSLSSGSGVFSRTENGDGKIEPKTDTGI